MKYVTNRISEEQIRNIVWAIQIKLNRAAFLFLYQEMSSWMDAVVWKITRKFPAIPLSKTEINALKDISFFTSLMKFDFTQNVPFPQFAIQQLKWFLYTNLRKFITKNYQILNYSTQLDEDKVLVRKQFNFVLRTKNEDNLQYYKQLLSPLERKIMTLKLEKYRSKEIAELLSISAKVVDNKWQKIKNQLRATFSDD